MNDCLANQIELTYTVRRGNILTFSTIKPFLTLNVVIFSAVLSKIILFTKQSSHDALKIITT